DSRQKSAPHPPSPTARIFVLSNGNSPPAAPANRNIPHPPLSPALPTPPTIPGDPMQLHRKICTPPAPSNLLAAARSPSDALNQSVYAKYLIPKISIATLLLVQAGHSQRGSPQFPGRPKVPSCTQNSPELHQAACLAGTYPIAIPPGPQPYMVCSWFCVVLRLQLLRNFQLPFRILCVAQISIRLAKQMVRNRIVRIHGNGALERPHRQRRLALFLQDLAHQDIRASGCSIQPNGTLKKLFGFIVLLNPRVSICQLVQRSSMRRIDRQLLLKLRDRFRNLRLKEIQLAQQKMCKRQLWINRDGFLSVLLCHRTKLQPEQHSGGEEITRG